jgi:neutral amino acid transport system ATP-binding protein
MTTSATSSSTSTEEMVLGCRDIHKSFLGVKAVNGATFDVPKGQITALIGPNGAGKTTVVNILSGAMKSDTGSMYIGNQDVTNWESYKIARLGLMRTFQLSRELGDLTVLENLLVAPKHQAGESLINIYFDTYGLYELRDSRARELSGGQKKLLEISRGVMAAPTVFLLDEPMAGVNPVLIERIGGYIMDLKHQGVTILMIEHNLNVVEKICDHVIVLAEGKTLATGRLSELRSNPDVVKAYLGEVINASTQS